MRRVVAKLAWTEGGIRQEREWYSGDPCNQRNIEEIVLLVNPERDDIFALASMAIPSVRWRFVEWKGWQVGDLGSLVGMYD